MACFVSESKRLLQSTPTLPLSMQTTLHRPARIQVASRRFGHFPSCTRTSNTSERLTKSVRILNLSPELQTRLSVAAQCLPSPYDKFRVHAQASQATILSEPQFPSERLTETVRVLNLSPELQTRLSVAMESLPSPYDNFRVYEQAQAIILSELPPDVLAAIRDFASSSSAPGALLITGMPLDPELPLTPTDGKRNMHKTSYVSEGCLVGVASLIGTPFSEKGGELIHNVCPVRKSESSSVELHVENAYFDDRPDFLAMYCLRQDQKKQALSTFVDAASVLSQMDPLEKAELQKPLFIVPSPPSHHEAMGGEKWSSARPVVGAGESLDFVCHFPGMKALLPTAQAALNRFEEEASHVDNTNAIALQPGSFLVLNNRKVAHGRTRFEAQYNGNDRWLQKVYVKAQP